MAPVPRTLDEETTNLIENLQRREKDLADYQVPRLRDYTGPLSVQQRYAAEIREDLNVFGQHIETLDILSDDLHRKSDRLAVKQLAEEFREASSRIRKEMRAALLHSKKAIDAQIKYNREELFKAAVVDDRNVEEKAADDELMKASNDVTEGLRRTIRLMQGELERSVLSSQMLEQSTATLRATSIRHDVLGSITLTSKQLIRALEKADWMDRLLILAGLAFFFLTILFILKQRVVDRGLRLALWWTRFIPISTGSGNILSMQEEGKVTTEAITEALSSILSNTAAAMTDSATSISQSVTAAAEHLSETESSVSSLLNSILPSPTESALQHAEL